MAQIAQLSLPSRGRDALNGGGGNQAFGWGSIRRDGLGFWRQEHDLFLGGLPLWILKRHRPETNDRASTLGSACVFAAAQETSTIGSNAELAAAGRREKQSKGGCRGCSGVAAPIPPRNETLAGGQAASSIGLPPPDLPLLSPQCPPQRAPVVPCCTSLMRQIPGLFHDRRLPLLPQPRPEAQGRPRLLHLGVPLCHRLHNPSRRNSHGDVSTLPTPIPGPSVPVSPSLVSPMAVDDRSDAGGSCFRSECQPRRPNGPSLLLRGPQAHPG